MMPNDPMDHDEAAVVADVSDGPQVVAGVDPPTEAELAAAAAASADGLKAEIDAHVEAVNIHDGRDR